MSDAVDASASTFSSRPGAVGTPPLHYGNPLGEQRALAAGAAIVDLSDRAVITLTGEDRLTWLDSLTSQSVAKLQPGESAETLLLDPSGRVEHAMRVIDDGVTTYLLLDAAAPTSDFTPGSELPAVTAPAASTPAAAPAAATPAAVAPAAATPPAVAPAAATPPAATPAAASKPLAGDPDALLAFLSRMVFMLRVEVGRSDLQTVGLFGPATQPGPAAPAAQPDGPAAQPAPTTAPPSASADSLPAAAPNGVPLTWNDPWGGVAAGGWQYAATLEHPASTWTYREVLVEPGTDLSAYPAAGTLALEALRIAAWRPRIGDADERTIPHELDWLRSAVHLSKGCYRGQETVAKVHNLGHPPRRLVMLHLDGSDGVLPARGSEVQLGGADAAVTIGTITASALHHELGPIALAVIKRSADPSADLVVIPVDDATLRIAAAQELIVPPDAGSVADIPRIPRLGAVAR